MSKKISFRKQYQNELIQYFDKEGIFYDNDIIKSIMNKVAINSRNKYGKVDFEEELLEAGICAGQMFIEDNVFKTIIPLAVVTLSQFTNKWQNWLELSDEYKAHIEKSLTKIVIDPNLKDNDWETVLLNLVPSWTEKGTKLSVLDWPRNQAITEDDIKKVPSWTEKGTKLIHKKVRYLIAILSLTAEPISLDDLMSAIGYSNKKTFRDNYLKPLEQLQFITKTDLENLSSPDQQYKLTKMGMLFLGNNSNNQSQKLSTSS